MIEQSQDRKAKLKADSNAFQSQQDRHDSAALSIRLARKSSKKRRAAAKKAATTEAASDSIAGWLQSSKGKQSSDRPMVQMKLSTGLPNPEGNEKAVTQVARFLIDTGKPLWTVDDQLFCRMCLAF